MIKFKHGLVFVCLNGVEWPFQFVGHALRFLAKQEENAMGRIFERKVQAWQEKD